MSNDDIKKYIDLSKLYTEVDFKQNKKDIELFMKNKAKFIKQNRTELLYSV